MGDRYRQHDILTATPVVLVAKLFEAAIGNGQRALELAGPEHLAERCRALGRAAAIVSELRASLDVERGGEIGANLDRLYGFVLERLVDANVEQCVEPVEEALRVLMPLAEAWDEVRRGAVTAPLPGSST